MIDVTVEHVAPATVAFVKMRGPYAQVPEAFGRLYAWIGSKGLTPVGMPRAVYLTSPATTPEAEAVWEVQSELAGQVEEAPADETGAGARRAEACDEACVTHRGPYETIAPTYAELAQWVSDHHYAVCGPPQEVYLSDPADTAPEDYLTQVRFPVRPE